VNICFTCSAPCPQYNWFFFTIKSPIWHCQLFKYHVVTSARSCNKVGHLFWFIILAQHETNDVILYIHSVHKHRGNSFQRQNYKMRLKQGSLNWINSMQVKKILFTNVFFSWSLCLLTLTCPKGLFVGFSNHPSSANGLFMGFA
jgi:hypothetical protein